MISTYITHRSGEAIKPKTFDSKRDILAEAPVSLKNAWEPMEEFLASTPISVSQLFVYKTPFDLWLRNR